MRIGQHAAKDTPRHQRRSDHRLVELVRRTGDTTLATRRGVPRSTAAGWLTQRACNVVTVAQLDESDPELRLRVARLEKRVERLRAMLAVAIALLRILQPDLTRLRIPNGSDKGRLLRALDRTRDVLGLRRVLQTIGLSPSRLFLHSLDSVAKVSSLVAFYVEEHNATIPHSAFKGQTPDEIYFGRGEVVPDQLA